MHHGPDNPLGNGLMVKLVFLNLSIKMLTIAVDEQLLILVGKSTVPIQVI